MDHAETRFAHLMKPILDLTKNWEIDLASQLGEYLEELDQMCISFDGGKTMMNFAEAALLIQGSTCIYGKKVELLHNLVFQTLDYISNKAKKRDKQTTATGENEKENIVAGIERDDIEFDLEQEDSEQSRQVVEMKEDPSEAVEIVPLPPESLIPAESHERQKYPLLSRKGEVQGSCKDARINNFTMDALGIVRLNLGPTRSYSLRRNTETWQDIVAPVPLRPLTEERVEEADGCDNFVPLEDNMMDMEPEEHVERQQVHGERRILRERPAVQPEAEEPKQLKETVDPWKWHDPYTSLGEDKPLKTGKCCKVPAGLEESGKRKRRGSFKLEDFGSWCTNAYDTRDRKLKNGPTFPDLNYIYLSKMGERVKVRKKILRKMGVCVSNEVLQKTYVELERQPEDPGEIRHPDPEVEDFSDQEHEDLLDEPEGGLGEQDLLFSDSQMVRISYEDLVKKSVEQFLVQSQKYAQETALSRRVKDWEDQINPVLSAEEDRVTFDIHDYGDRIVSFFGGIGERRSFASIVKGMDNHEACRYMLASLQLANDYTVEIDKQVGLEESIDTVGLTLLSKHRAHERLKTYNAASNEH
ncbi:condensin-2 complex subunit H2 [Chanos chanos]|uniref:Condensin-2 complex subunit H2 n=1 Tax=Chanos chanos TaxID=29144 RepID=A0A6J2VCK7_CHACN|nr:condensin-2 complex subunit H2 [Chanos chanos]